MKRNVKLLKINWKFRLMIVFGMGLVAFGLLKLSASQARTDSEPVVEKQSLARQKEQHRVPPVPPTLAMHPITILRARAL